MVTWGSNTVHTFGAPATTAGAPASGSLFGAAPSAPATPSTTTGFGFGGSSSTPTALVGGSLFGGTPAPSGGTGLFGSAPAPMGGGFFGGGTPAPTGGSSFFGGTPTASAPSSTSIFGSAPAPGSSLFGGTSATGSSLFGGTPAPAMGGFGALSLPQQQQQPQIPAQAALLGFLGASARQEEEHYRGKLENLSRTYSGQEAVDESSPQSSKFVAITYNPLTPEQLRMRNIAGAGHQQIFEVARPPQVCGRDWQMALVNNPDPEQYEPVALIGASSLQARIAWQQQQAQALAEDTKRAQTIFNGIRQRDALCRQTLHGQQIKSKFLKRRLLQVMAKVESLRGANKSIQPDEYQALLRLKTLLGNVDKLRDESWTVGDQAVADNHARLHDIGDAALDGVCIPKLKQVLDDHGDKLQKLGNVAKTDCKDVALVIDRVARMSM